MESYFLIQYSEIPELSQFKGFRHDQHYQSIVFRNNASCCLQQSDWQTSPPAYQAHIQTTKNKRTRYWKAGTHAGCSSFGRRKLYPCCQFADNSHLLVHQSPTRQLYPVLWRSLTTNGISCFTTSPRFLVQNLLYILRKEVTHPGVSFLENEFPKIEEGRHFLVFISSGRHYLVFFVRMTPRKWITPPAQPLYCNQITK